MKRYYLRLLLLFTTVSVLISCEDYLDVSPDLGIDVNEVFTDYFSTRGAVDRASRLIHNYVYNQTDWSSEIGAMSDECQMSQERFPTHNTLNAGVWMDSGAREIGGMRYINQGTEFDGSDFNSEPVAKAFLAIRAVNSVLDNIDLLKEYPTELGYTPQQLKDQLVGQSYFLRAFHYFQIIRRYGGFPIMNKVYSTSYNFDEERPTYLESTDALIEDCDKAIDLLPEVWNDQNEGRATKTSARALKAMALLYAASPLMNPDLNPYGSNSKTYNISYAEKAAVAAAEAINSYSLGGYSMYSMDNYTENWLSRTPGFPKEAIIVAPFSRHSDPVGGIIGEGWVLPQFAGGWFAESPPTHNAVEWFETALGYDVNDPEAVTNGGFDPNNPYANRDPRLKQLIFTHGDDMFEGLPNPSGQNQRVLDASSNPVGWHYNFDVSKNKMFTGYYHKGKHRWLGCDRWNRIGGYYRSMPHIRVAQLYLDYAEAVNEAYGPNGTAPGSSLTAIEAINVVRNRANMPNVLSKYSASKEEFRKRIYNERAVELFHEQHRWHDLRRWKLAKEVLGQGNIYAADIKTINGQTVYGKKIIEGAIRVFEDKHYWYPFPQEVMDIMSKFEQNPGW
ncbi:RagB/SusD family nutrient uptake outer membrane protein [Seonamhaeicola algicola]|uniref:RagB/SusD family nutrient uptake outer membrane protein n=1 Tax=Seonamhaeicola algicola TaxID=1719036 RepID=A0A5C7AQG6_9FLAO|nr:RagB/SusD family nutrient uptake outer membrane protein [Seonamhaeicola algicola]TXE09939.1 RagB/SusD family nutrient uptake outer membrane protein [Seonamhaeicola algicola]